MPSNLEQRLADLIVNFGANIQPGQIVDIGSGLGKEELTRAITASAYKRGAKFVDVSYWDPHLKRERVKYAPDEVLDFVPPWYGERTLKLGEERGATISLSGPIAPHLFDDLDPERLGRDVFPRVKEWATVINERTVNWCVAPGPSMKWAQLVHPDLDPEAALDKLWEQVVHICRLDEDDPVAAWQERSKVLKGVASRLGERHFDAIHLEGPGTDLTVGLLPTSRWNGGGDETVDGILHMANLPTEEVFTSPDPQRAEGVVRATKPLYYAGPDHRWAHRPFRGRPRSSGRCRLGSGDPARTARPGRRRDPAGRACARRPRGPNRPARHGLLRHVARRECGQPHRARVGVRVRRRGIRHRSAESLDDPCRLHDRLA